MKEVEPLDVDGNVKIMAFKMKYKNLKKVVKQLRSAVVAHGKQADAVEKHIKKLEKKK